MKRQDFRYVLQHEKPNASSLATHGTELMRWRGGGEAHSGCEIQLILGNSGWRSETKALEEGGEGEKDLHPGQTFSETHPATCKNEELQNLDPILTIVKISVREQVN